MRFHLSHLGFALAFFFLALLLFVLALHVEIDLNHFDEVRVLVVPTSGNWQMRPTSVLAQTD